MIDKKNKQGWGPAAAVLVLSLMNGRIAGVVDELPQASSLSGIRVTHCSYAIDLLRGILRYLLDFNIAAVVVSPEDMAVVNLACKAALVVGFSSRGLHCGTSDEG